MGKEEIKIDLEDVLTGIQKPVSKMTEVDLHSILSITSKELNALCRNRRGKAIRERVQGVLARGLIQDVDDERTGPMNVTKIDKMFDSLTLATRYNMPVSFKIYGETVFRGMITGLDQDYVMIQKFDEKKTRKIIFFRQLEAWGGIDMNVSYNVEEDHHHLNELWADHRLATIQRETKTVSFEQLDVGKPRIIFSGNPEHKGNDELPWCLWVDDEGKTRITLTTAFYSCLDIWMRKERYIAQLREKFAEKKNEPKKRGKKK